MLNVSKGTRVRTMVVIDHSIELRICLRGEVYRGGSVYVAVAVGPGKSARLLQLLSC